MKKLQVLAVLFFVMGAVNISASDNSFNVDSYEKQNNSRRSSKTIRNSPEKPEARRQYCTAAQVRVEAKPKSPAKEAQSSK